MKALVFPAACVLLVALTVACVVAGDGDVILALTPGLVLGALVAAWRLPLRWPLLVTTFLALTLENPSDLPASGQWKSPFYEVGAALLVHLNVTIPHKVLAFSGMDVILVSLFAVAAARYLGGSRIDRGDDDGDAGPIGPFAALSLAGAAWMWVYGMARGDADVANSLWQVQRVAYLPLLVLLFRLGFRGVKDGVALGKVVVAAACLKAVLAIYIRAVVPPPPGEPTLLYATSHADSMLFGVAFCAVLAHLIHQREREAACPGRRRPGSARRRHGRQRAPPRLGRAGRGSGHRLIAHALDGGQARPRACRGRSVAAGSRVHAAGVELRLRGLPARPHAQVRDRLQGGPLDDVA